MEGIFLKLSRNWVLMMNNTFLEISDAIKKKNSFSLPPKKKCLFMIFSRISLFLLGNILFLLIFIPNIHSLSLSLSLSLSYLFISHFSSFFWSPRGIIITEKADCRKKPAYAGSLLPYFSEIALTGQAPTHEKQDTQMLSSH